MGSVQQQIYASLADESLKAGHHTHAATDGLPPALIERHEEICNRWGQFEASAPFKRSLVHLPVYDGGDAPSHHLIILITDQGRDARGRPGAMLRHVVRMDAATFESFDCNPFHVLRQGLLLAHWTPDTPFPDFEGVSDHGGRTDLQSIFPERYPLLRAMLAHLLAKGRLHLASAEDSLAAEETLEQLLELVPTARRERLSMTTFAYANANDYDLAVTRRAETSLRASLEKLMSEPVEGLDPVDRAYLDRLFHALETKDWPAAEACVRGEPLRQAPVPPRPASGPGGPSDAGPRPAVPFRHSGVITPAVDDDDDADMQAWAPSFRRAEPKRSGGGKRGLWVAAVVVVAVAVGVFALLQRRGGDDGPRGGRVNTRVEAAADLSALVDEHVRRLGTMIAQGSRDFDVTEAMRGMQARLDENVRATLDRERATVAAGATATEGDPSAMVLHLRTSSERLEASARRLARLEEVLGAADVATLRTTATSAPTIDLGEAEPSTPLAARVARWAAGMGSAVTAVRATAALSWPPRENDWSAQTDSLLAVADSDPALATLAAVVQAQSGIIATLDADAGRLGGPLAPFDAATADAARSAADDARRAWGGLPSAIDAMDRFVVLGERAMQRPRGSTAQEWMESLDRETAPGASLAALLELPAARAWLARWKVEVQRANPPLPPDAKGLVAVNADETSDVAALLDALAAAPTPAPADLIERARQQQRRAREPVHGALVGGWLRQQEAGRARTGSAFEDVYAGLRSARDAFVNTPTSANFTTLRTRWTALVKTDLDAVARDPQRSPQVAAVRAFGPALEKRVPAAVRSVEIELLRRADYSGTDRSLAQARALLVRRSDQDVLWQAGAPPMLAPAGAAFQKIRIGGGTSFEVGADEGLALLVRDEKSGKLWAHVYVDGSAEAHVLARLSGTHDVRLSEEQQRSEQGAELPARPDGRGDPIARVTVDVDPAYWAALARIVPTLP